MPATPYRQYLPALDLALERLTTKVPSDGAWYLTQSGKRIGRYRTRNEAMKAWKAVLTEAGWKPSEKPVNSREVLLRESRERWARNRAG
jgi:hypothetical protein